MNKPADLELEVEPVAPGREGVVLPQILTPQIVLDHIAS